MPTNGNEWINTEISESDSFVGGGKDGDQEELIDDGDSSIKLTRRLLIRAAVAGLPSFAGLSTSASATQQQREGETIEGSTIRPAAFSDTYVASITTDKFNNIITNTSFAGVNEQVASFDDTVNNGNGLQGFPREGSEFGVLSSGLAEEALGTPGDFRSTDIENGRSFNDYSPDGYDAFNVADLELDFQVPEDAEGIAFDYKFCTDESPSWLGSNYQDFFEAILFTPDGFDNIATINGDAVTVDTADTVSNTPGGNSKSPEAPLPDPQDTAYNAVTDLQTVSWDISNYQGEELTLLFRVADASDGFYDSAVILDNLRFTNDVETDTRAFKDALENYEAAFKTLIESHMAGQAHYIATLYNELGDSFANSLVNAWGYRAGEVSESELGEERAAALDSLLDAVSEKGDFEITQQRALALYEFYDEVFNEISADNNLQTLKDQMTAYHVGSAADQEAPLLFDDSSTFTEILGQDWGIQEELFDRVQSNYDPDDGDYQTLTSAIQNIVEKFENRAQDNIAHKERQAEEVLKQTENTNGLEVHAQTFDSGVSSEEFESELAISATAIVAAVGAGTIGLLTGYVAVNCLPAWTAEQSLEGVETTELSVSNPFADYLTTGWNSGATLYSFTSDEEINTQAAGFLSGFYTGAKTGAIELAAETLALGLEWGAASAADADIEIDLPDITEEENLGFFGSMWDRIQSLWNGESASESSIGEAEGTITVTNTSDVKFEPKLTADYELFHGRNDPTGYAPQIEGDESEMSPGEQREFTVTYNAPLDAGVLSGSMRVDLGVSPAVELPTFDPRTDLLPIGVCEMDYFAYEKATATDSFKVNKQCNTQTVAKDSIQAGNKETYTYSVASDTTSALIKLNYAGEDHYSDLHVYDSNGNHTGYNYDTNEMETQIPNSTHSSRDTGQNQQEHVTIEGDLESEYEIEIVTPEVGTVIQGLQTSATTVDFEVESTDVPELDPKLATSGDLLLDGVERGETSSFGGTVKEANGDNDLGQVSLSATDFEHEGGKTTIDAAEISFSQNDFTLAAGTSTVFNATVSIPKGTEDTEPAAEGTYTGQIEINPENDDSTTLNATIKVDVPVSEFADANGIVTNDGVFHSIDEWRKGLIQIDTVFDCIDAWRAQDSVE